MTKPHSSGYPCDALHNVVSGIFQTDVWLLENGHIEMTLAP